MSAETIAPVKPISSHELAWTEWSEVPRFAVRYRHLSRAALGEGYHVGVAIEELGPGKQSAPLHYHVFEEEHVYILEGRLTLRLGGDSHERRRGIMSAFRRGRRPGIASSTTAARPAAT